MGYEQVTTEERMLGRCPNLSCYSLRHMYW